jgi:hypothetical protein
VANNGVNHVPIAVFYVRENLDEVISVTRSEFVVASVRQENGVSGRRPGFFAGFSVYRRHTESPKISPKARNGVFGLKKGPIRAAGNAERLNEKTG